MVTSVIRKNFQSVRGRLFLLIASLVLPMLAIVAALCWESYRSHRNLTRAELRNTARAVASLVDSEVDGIAIMVRTLASTKAASDKDWVALDATARRILGSGKRWLVVVDLSGQQIINTRLPASTPLPKIELAADFVEAMRDGRAYTSNLATGTMAQKLVVHVGYPFVDPVTGERLGFSIVVDPEYFSEVLDVSRFAPGGVLSILDRDGRIIVRNPNQKEFGGRYAMPDMVRAVTEQREGMGDSVTLENIPVLTAFVRARSGWTVAIGTPKAKVFSAAQRMLVLAVGSSLLVAILAVGFALGIGRAVVQSVEDLTADAELMGRGKVPAPRPKDLREINYVGVAMRDMAQTLALELHAKTRAEADLRIARDQIHEYAQELEKRVEERTTSLKEAVTQMEEFSYTVSHDLRSPLRAISGYADVLLTEYAHVLDEAAVGYLDRIKRAGVRMDQLTTDVLAYSRVARADVRTEKADLEKIVHSTVEHYSELHPRHADISIVAPMPKVMAHEQSLSQALANLLTNAAKFVKPGKRPTITIRAETRNERVRIWVEDEGIGIPKQHQDKLFRMFERAPTSGTYDGTGVGLAIVRKCLEKMGGSCGVESDGITGSRFWLELHAAPSERAAASALQSPAPASV